MKIPTVFISSTSEDLKAYRQAARDAAVAARFHPEMMEYFPAGGQYPPLEACRAKVGEADVIVAIVAHRYGSVPDAADPKNITWLECEEAVRKGKEVPSARSGPLPPQPSPLPRRWIDAHNL
jgi:hypothetical protein